MPSVVQFGAGAIGRGFLAPLFHEAGYEVVFVDKDKTLIAALNAARVYPLSLVTNEGAIHQIIAPVSALLADNKNMEAVFAALNTCDFAVVSVGPAAVALVETVFVPFTKYTERQGDMPLNVIVAENDPNAAKQMTERFAKAAGKGVVFVQAIVGRMVPPPVADLLAVVAEPFGDLLVEAGVYQGQFPHVAHMEERTNFPLYVREKLYIHNAGHAVLAYHGFLRGHRFIYECMEDPETLTELNGFWQEVNMLTDDILPPITERLAFETELLGRFANRALSDTVVRVARDPIRKLQANDRLFGPTLAYFNQTGCVPPFILRAIAAALRFDELSDPASARLQSLIQEKGVAQAVIEIQSIPILSPGIVPFIEAAYNAQGSDTHP